ncbi:hypothetical protein V1264_001416 [Littorina saxatilis]|uniref:Reverse transcriptase domain-containing protein n=1 Tax=Littorina saxatilis TaxID=31220 RepID=A0AAN9GPQ1_9CAEN
METPTSVREALRPGDWATSVDLTDAYFHVLIHVTDRKWLRFPWGGKAYQFRALLFGLSLAPWIFTMVVRQLCALLRQEGIRLRAYLDDWLILHQDRYLCEVHTQRVLSQAAQLGFSVNLTKSELEPSQKFSYLGMEFDTLRWSVRPSQRRIDKLQNQIHSLYGENHASARVLTSVLGQMESMASLIPLGRVHKRPFQASLQSRWYQTSQDWNVPIALGTWFQQTTSVWLLPDLFLGVPIVRPPPERELFTDASLTGWGAHLNEHMVSGIWDCTQASLHINVLELEAVSLALLAFKPFLEGCHVRLHTDNMSVASYVNKQGGGHGLPVYPTAHAAF